MTPQREGTPGAPGAQTDLGLQERLEALEGAVRRLTGANDLRALLDRHVPPGESVAVVAEPATAPLEALGRPVVGVLPETAGSAAGVARLEAARMGGVRFVVVPDAARSQLEHDAHLSEHLRDRFAVIAEDH